MFGVTLASPEVRGRRSPAGLAVPLPSMPLQRETLFPPAPSALLPAGHARARGGQSGPFLVFRELPPPYISIYSGSSLYPQEFWDFFVCNLFQRKKENKQNIFLLLPLYFSGTWIVLEPS